MGGVYFGQTNIEGLASAPGVKDGRRDEVKEYTQQNEDNGSSLPKPQKYVK